MNWCIKTAIELALNEDVITGSIHNHCPEDLVHAQQLQPHSKETFVIDGEIC